MKHLANLRAYLHLDMLSNQQQVSSICSRSLASPFIKQVLFVCLILMSCLFSTYSLASSTPANKTTIELSAEEREWLNNNPHIKLVALADQAPFSFKGHAGSHSGIMADVFSHLNRSIAQQIKFELMETSTMIHMRAKGKGIYGAGSVFNTPRHQKEYLLTDPFFFTPFFLFTRKNNLISFNHPNDLKGKRIAVPRGHRAMAEYLDNIGSVEKVIVDSPLEQMQKVVSGEADALMGYSTYSTLINNYLMVDLAMAFVTKSEMGVHVGINPEHPILHRILNKAIATISEQTRQNILAKWTQISQKVSLQTELTEKERNWLLAHPTIQIGVDADYAPYSFREDDGSYSGIAMEFTDYLSKQLGVSMNVVPGLSWPEIVDGMRERKLDMITTLAHRPEREAFTNFTEIYLPTPLVIMRRSGDASISSEADLEGRTVAMVEGYSSSARILEEHSGVKSLIVKNARDGLFAVSTGKADAYVGVLGINLHLANEYGITNLEVASLYGSGTNGQRFGVRKDWPELATILDKALKAIPEGRKRKIFENWLPSPTTQLTITEKDEPLVELSLTEEEKAWLAENPVIHLGNSVDWPPFGFINKEGVYSGIAADYVAAIEKMLGITIEPAKLESWKDTVDAARKGEVDLLDAVVVTPQRSEFLTFTKPYISYPVVLFAHKDVDYIANMSVINGQRVSVIGGSALHDILINNHPEFEIVASKNARAGLLAVEKGGASAFIGNLPTASQVISREGISDLKVAGETPYRYDLTIGINKNKPILASLIQKALDSIPEEKHNEIYRKWMSVTFEHEVDYTFFAKLFALSIFIFILILVWNRQHQIKKLMLEVESRKEIEESLFMSEHYNRTLFEKSPIGLALCQTSGELVDINPAFASILGRTVEETKTLSYWDITPEKYAQQEQERLSDLEKTGRYGAYEKEYIHKDGHLVPVRLSGQFLEKDGTKFIWSSVEDITERKKADQALRKSEKDLKTIFDNMQDAFYRADIDGCIIMLSPSAERLTQYKVEELMGKNLADYYIDPDGRKNFLNALEEEGGNVQGYEAAIRIKDGSQIWISTNAHYFFDDEGNINGVEGTIRDITARKKAEENLKNSERGLSEAQRIAHLGSWEWDIITNDLNWTDQIFRIFGLEPQEFVPTYPAFLDCIHPDDRQSVTDAVENAVSNNQPYEIEHRIVTPDGEVRYILEIGEVQYDKNNKPINMIGSVQDITERKQAEDEKERLQRELQQAQKMEALGKLTGGIAHEYNNMLGITIGFAGLLESALVEQPKLAKYAHEIQHAGERGAKLTRKLLTFSRQKIPEAKSVNLNELLHKQQHMLEKTLTVRINLVLNLQENLWQVFLDDGDMEDVTINMSINAMHAIEGNGQLTIQTCNQKINQMDAQSLGITPGDYVLLSFTDTGCGIDKEIKEKIFDPFFTTKGLEGTGLGLSMVYGFMQNSGGAIKVYSEQGESTQFTLYFPRYHDASHEQQSEKENYPEESFIGNQTILVVDDEPALLDLSREILSLHGFKVICTESAKDALSILQHESIDILISDIIMPEMDGYQLAATVKEKYPSIKIQLSSGFTDDRNMGMVDKNLQHNLLLKPFNSQALLQKIRELCDEN